MFGRKLVIVALVAVVLLGAFASADGRIIKHRRKASMERPCPMCLAQKLTNLANTFAGVRPTIDPSRFFTSLWERPCPTCLVQSLTNSVNTIAGSKVIFDPNSGLHAQLKDRKLHRGKASVEPAGSFQIAGGIAAIDPT